MNESQLNLKKIAFLIVGGIFIIGLFAWLWHYTHTGKVIITTNSQYNDISLVKTSGKDDQEKPESKKARGKLSATVGTGEYTVSVQGNSVATVQTIQVKASQTQYYSINPLNTTGIEPVAYKNAQDITASSNELVYLGASSGILEKIDNQNHVTQIDPRYKFREIEWSSPSFGIGQDRSGYLYSVVNGSVNLLQVPFSYDDKTVNFDVSSDAKIYVSHGSEVYRGGLGGGFKKIYNATSSKPELAATDSQIAVSDSRYGPNGSNIPKPTLATISSSGKVSKKSVEAERLAWSPNGKYLAAVNQTNPVIYDSGLREVTTADTSSVVGQLAWLNKDTLLYTINSELWTYNLPQQRAQLLSNTPLSSSISGLYISDDRSYVYLTTYSSISSGGAIKRVGLKGQSVPDYLYRLQDIMPQSFSGYSISLVNFSGAPSIIVQPYSGAPSINYTQQAETVLKARGFDTSKFIFQVSQPVAD